VLLRVAAPAESYWRLAEGTEDADTLFFERKLVMEGDTELGLLLKNTLDAIGPLVPQVLARRA
jgi:predicted lipid carrier protein YhbT